MNWKYKINLKDQKVFQEIEASRKITLPVDLKQLIIQANAATPDKYHFVADGKERILGAIFSFNKNEKDVDSVFTALEVITDKDLFPFGIDPFGNYICLRLSDELVVFLNHETNKVNSTNKKLTSFINSLF